MIKAFKRLVAFLAGILIVFGAAKTLFNGLHALKVMSMKYGMMMKNEKKSK